MINLPPGERLLLTVDRVLPEEQCERCKGVGSLLDDVPPYYGATAMVDCWACHSTGRVSRRLRGWVRVLYSGKYCENPKLPFYAVEGFGGVHLLSNLADRVVAAWKDGTLPDEIAANLEEVDCE